MRRGQQEQNDRQLEPNADAKRGQEEIGGLLGVEPPLQTAIDVALEEGRGLPAGGVGGGSGGGLC